MADEIKSREDLYNIVWSKPMMNLAEDFGISGRGLAKLCERLKVPVPPRGYWRKVSLGQRIKKTPLPSVEFSRYDLWKNQSELTDLERRRKAVKERSEVFKNPEIEIKDNTLKEAILRTLQDEQNRVPTAIVSEQEICNPSVKKFLQEHGFNRYSSPSSTDSGNLTIDVTDNCAMRAGLLMESLIQGFQEREWNFCIEKNKPTYLDRMYVRLFEQKIYISLVEHVANKRFPLTEKEIEAYKRNNPYRTVPKNKYVPTATGRLVLIIKSNNSIYQSWEDRGAQVIEGSIKDVMLGFIYVAIKSSNEAVLALEREQKLKLEQARKLEEERLKKLEGLRYERLLADSEAYYQMQKIQRYVEFVKDQSQSQVGDPENETAKWIEWAESKITNLNPLKNGFPKFTTEEKQETGNKYSSPFLDDLFQNY